MHITDSFTFIAMAGFAMAGFAMAGCDNERMHGLVLTVRPMAMQHAAVLPYHAMLCYNLKILEVPAGGPHRLLPARGGELAVDGALLALHAPHDSSHFAGGSAADQSVMYCISDHAAAAADW